MTTVLTTRLLRPNASNGLRIPMVRRALHRLEFEDLHFGTDREVFLPGAAPLNAPELEPDRQFSAATGGLDVLAVALAFGARSAGKRVVVAGHTDSAGSASHNLALSGRRAESVWLVLSGDARTWSQHAQANAEVADWQEVLLWVHGEFGWDTHPGDVDGDWGPNSAGARDRFRERASAEFGISLPTGAANTARDWNAVFQLYERGLESRLDIAAGHLDAVRAKFAGHDEPVLACGEDWPLEAIALDGYESAVNRRVDIFFLDADDDLDLSGDLAQRLYDGRRFDLHPIPADVIVERLTTVEIVLLDPHGDRMVGAEWEMSVDGVIAASGVSDANGVARGLLVDRPESVDLAWGDALHPMAYHSFHMIRLSKDETVAGHQRLANLGFRFFAGDESNVVHAEANLGLTPTGLLENLLPWLELWHDDGILPDADLEQSADGLDQLAFLDELHHIDFDHDEAPHSHEASEAEPVGVDA